MNKIKTLVLFFCIATLSIWFAVPAMGQQTLKILTYNVRNCRGLDDEKTFQTDRIAAIVRAQAADLTGIQELDKQTQRSGNRNILQELVDKTGLNGTYGPAIEFQGGQYGIGMLTREKPLTTRFVPLPGKEEKRVLLIAEFENCVFFDTHLSLTKADRLKSVAIINAERDKYQKPVVLVGDFNATPDEETIVEFQKSWQKVSPDAFTFPANGPKIQIDYIFVSCPNQAQVKVREAKVVNAAVESDHRPVVSVIELP